MGIKNIGFPLDDELYTKLRILCFKKGVTLKEFLTGLIKEQIEKAENEKE